MARFITIAEVMALMVLVALIALSSRCHDATLPSRSLRAPIALPSHSHRTPIALPSRSHRTPIALPSRSHRAPIVLSSRSHRTPIAIPSRSHRDLDAFSALGPIPGRRESAVKAPSKWNVGIRKGRKARARNYLQLELERFG
ncbi:hypothetical protein Bbelb_101130 [Branchiostoma belcheri]|nr:hypothetical protein Bbelb_101130 [Branchiostoma belcheri]